MTVQVMPEVGELRRRELEPVDDRGGAARIVHAHVAELAAGVLPAMQGDAAGWKAVVGDVEYRQAVHERADATADRLAGWLADRFDLDEVVAAHVVADGRFGGHRPHAVHHADEPTPVLFAIEA